MSVRRLADEAVQPESFAFSSAMSGEVKRWLGKYPQDRKQSAVIPLLMLAQEQEGWVTRAAIEHVAEMLDMPLIRVLEVATFYTQFQLAPVGTRAHIQVCGTTPCMLRGSGELIELCKKKINPEPFHLNEEGTLSWEEVECQGACVNAPMVMIFKDTYEDLTPQRLEEIIDAFEAGKGDTIEPGPQIDRIFSGAAGGLTALTDEKAVTGKAKASSSRAAATGTKVPPSQAAKPDTSAAVTDPAIKSPSPVKADNGATSATAKSAPQKAAKPSLEDKNRPEGIERPAETDDLKLISGVGPKIEGILHEIGIFTFAQVAKWKKAEREWVDGYLSFHGRIERDDWVKQAKALAKGGEAEYIKVFGKKPR
ncbi:NADH-quinone oxidoreductase subunit E [Nitratireductor aquimarinus]|uniref:NADH-quinone oxidoreductase subunit E n=1 Tax=Nitratireductor aquimarinus TaxID=889300 RepID=A0ABU4AIS1_9HYPH|nr:MULTISPECIES: NADH-quinone oxidoreductase subunit E [Nitratireductor]MDV6226156.1 NADH-quinone oxidoreductase subunit E [Nitratireductor aquimarinus]